MAAVVRAGEQAGEIFRENAISLSDFSLADRSKGNNLFQIWGIPQAQPPYPVEGGIVPLQSTAWLSTGTSVGEGEKGQQNDSTDRSGVVFELVGDGRRELYASGSGAGGVWE